MAIEYLYVYDEIFPREMLIVIFTIHISLRLFQQFSMLPIRHYHFPFLSYVINFLQKKITKPKKLEKTNWCICLKIFFSTTIGHSNQKCMHKNGFHEHVFHNLICFSWIKLAKKRWPKHLIMEKSPLKVVGRK